MSIYIQSELQKSLVDYEQMYLATVNKSIPQVVQLVHYITITIDVVDFLENAGSIR